MYMQFKARKMVNSIATLLTIYGNASCNVLLRILWGVSYFSRGERRYFSLFLRVYSCTSWSKLNPLKNTW